MIVKTRWLNFYRFAKISSNFYTVQNNIKWIEAQRLLIEGAKFHITDGGIVSNYTALLYLNNFTIAIKSKTLFSLSRAHKINVTKILSTRRNCTVQHVS